MEIKNYFFAGLDFIFDKDYKPWFLEANYAPHATWDYEQLYGDQKPLREVARLMKGIGGELCVITAQTEPLKEHDDYSKWVYKKLKEHIPDLRLCYLRNNRKKKTKLMGTKGYIFKPDCIFRYNYELSHAFDKIAIVINSVLTQRFVHDKFLTLMALEGHGVRKPRSFLAKNYTELKRFIRMDVFKNGLVIKPVNKSYGRGVKIFDSNRITPPLIRIPKIVEERVRPRLIKGMYWDVRTFVVNGKYCDGITRVGKGKITNLHRGGKACRTPKKILSVLEEPSIKIVRILDKAIERVKNNEPYLKEFYNNTIHTDVAKWL